MICFDEDDLGLGEEYWVWLSARLGNLSVRDRAVLLSHLGEIHEAVLRFVDKYTEADHAQIHLSEEQASLDGVPARRFVG